MALQLPKHDGLVALTFTVIDDGEVTLTEAEATHPVASVTVAEVIPAH